MQNCKTSARTAAKSKFKCSLLFRQATIAAILLLCAVFVHAQDSNNVSYGMKTLLANTTGNASGPFGYQKDTVIATFDTVKVVLLIADTSHHFSTWFEAMPCEDTTNRFVWCGKEVKEDRGNYGSGLCYWIYGYSVQEKRYTRNSFINGSCFGYAFYLDENKQPLKTMLIVWQSVIAK